jgi:hypothetical protein
MADVGGSTIDGLVAEVVLEASVVAVLEDLVLLLQPLRTNPARMRVNNGAFFIGGLSCASTDHPRPLEFAVGSKEMSCPTTTARCSFR